MVIFLQNSYLFAIFRDKHVKSYSSIQILRQKIQSSVEKKNSFSSVQRKNYHQIQFLLVNNISLNFVKKKKKCKGARLNFGQSTLAFYIFAEYFPSLCSIVIIINIPYCKNKKNQCMFYGECWNLLKHRFAL